MIKKPNLYKRTIDPEKSSRERIASIEKNERALVAKLTERSTFLREATAKLEASHNGLREKLQKEELELLDRVDALHKRYETLKAGFQDLNSTYCAELRKWKEASAAVDAEKRLVLKERRDTIAAMDSHRKMAKETNNLFAARKLIIDRREAAIKEREAKVLAIENNQKATGKRQLEIAESLLSETGKLAQAQLSHQARANALAVKEFNADTILAREENVAFNETRIDKKALLIESDRLKVKDLNQKIARQKASLGRARHLAETKGVVNDKS